MKRILVATDLSVRSDHAIERAFDLARRHDLSLTLVHVVDEELPFTAAEAQERAAAQLMSDALARLDPGESVPVSLRIVAGQESRTILSLADAEDAGLILLGRHRNATSDLLIAGTTLERVVRQSPRPVLVVRSAAGESYSNVLVGVECAGASRTALGIGRRLAGSGRIRLVHACAQERQLADLAAIDGPDGSAAPGATRGPLPDVETWVVEGDARSVLRRQARDMGADLVVLAARRTADADRLPLSGLAASFLVAPPSDVLIVKA